MVPADQHRERSVTGVDSVRVSSLAAPDGRGILSAPDPMSIDREESTHAPSLHNVVPMDYLIILIVVLVVSAIVLAWLFVQWRRRRQTRRDELLRVGDETEVDSVTASRRAEGKAAWTRISGGVRGVPGRRPRPFFRRPVFRRSGTSRPGGPTGSHRPAATVPRTERRPPGASRRAARPTSHDRKPSMPLRYAAGVMMAAHSSYRRAGSETLPGRGDSVHWNR